MFIILQCMLAFAQSVETDSESKMIRVGVDPTLSMTFLDNQQMSGYAVSVFEDAIKNADSSLQVKYVEVPWNEWKESLVEDKVDVYISSLTITAEREKEFDFSFPYLMETLSLYNYNDQYNQEIFVLGILIFFVVAILYGILEDVAFLDALYWALVTLATVGYGDYAPKTKWGKILTMAWIGAIFCLGWWLVKISSVEEVFLDMKDPIFVLEGSFAETFCKTTKAFCIPVDSENLLSRLHQGYYVLDDTHVGYPHKSAVVAGTEQPYGFCFRKDSPFLDTYNIGFLSFSSTQINKHNSFLE